MSGHAGGGRRKKQEEHEEHENHERWLVSYADMVTLLMVLFVVMFAMSAVDEKKYAELKDGLAAGFGNSDALLEGNESILDQAGSSAVRAIAPQVNTDDMTPEQQQAVADAVQQAQALQNQRSWDEAAAEAERLEKVRKALLAALGARGLAGDVTTSYDHRGLVVSLVSRHVVFQANLASLSLRGQQVVDAIAPVLARLEDDLQVDGHTNQVPVKPKYYDTDWDLSAARAVTVLRRLEERHGLPTARLSVAGYGSTRPLLDPDEPGSQEVNKRVDIVVLTGLAPQDAALLPEAAASLDELEGLAATDEPGSEPGREGRGRGDRRGGTQDGTDSDTESSTDTTDEEGAQAAALRDADPEEKR